jgi:phosphoribosylaminoimidazole-succinocarboxamide synthase
MIIEQTQFDLPGVTGVYRGKVRDVYVIEEQALVLVATDRISAFDHLLPNPIPHKGQTLNQTAQYFLERTRTLCRNHALSFPDPNVTIGLKCEAYPIEVVVRGHLCGHAWRVYRTGERTICGVRMPDGLKENDPFPEPIVTPSTKSKIGHDIDVSEKEIVKAGLVSADEWAEIRYRALQLFADGQQHARERGLILADTKYEFGTRNFDIYLIDEIHTPDSSRYFYAEGFEERQAQAQAQKQLSKEFVREWLMANGFQGAEGQTPPPMPEAVVREVSQRYVEVYETLTGRNFVPRPDNETAADVESRIVAELKKMGLA